MGKVYRFYLKKSEEDCHDDELSGIIPEDRYPLYAFTKEENIAEEFRKSRNMKAYVEISSKMSKDEYRVFANSKTSCMLQLHTFQTCKNRFRDSWKDVAVIATWLEIETTKQFIDDIIAGLKEDCVRRDPNIFTKSIRNALGILEYNTIYEIGRAHYESPAIMVDELAYFAIRYKELLNFEVE